MKRSMQKWKLIVLIRLRLQFIRRGVAKKGPWSDCSEASSGLGDVGWLTWPSGAVRGLPRSSPDV